MDAETLLENFATVAEAPRGLPRLRDLIFQLATKGRLVAQDPGDEPAEALIDELAAARGSLATPLAPSDRSPVPMGWTWASLGQATINRDSERIPLKKADRQARHGKYGYYGASGVIDTIDDFIFDGELLLIGEDGANLVLRSTPIAFMAKGRFWVNNHAHVLDSTSPTALRYLAIVINAIDLRPYLTGIAQPKLNQSRMNRIRVPLPPLAEQERIVAKVDELLGLCDEHQVRQERRHHATDQFRRSALHALIEAETPGDLHRAWERVSADWSTVTRHADSVPALRETILQLAVQGHLARRHPKEQPARDLLASIAQEQLRLKAEGRLPGVRLPVIAPELPAPSLPDGWEWTRLGAVLRHCQNGLATTPNEDGAGLPLLRISAGTSDPNGVVDLRDHKFAYITAEIASPYVLDPGDLLACRFNGNLRFVGRVAIVPEHEGTYVHPDKLIRMKAIFIDHRFLAIALNSAWTRSQIEEAASTTAGNIGINGAQLQALHIPVPPLAEQAAIASRVEELLRLCTALGQSMPQADRAADQLAAGLTHRVVSV